MTPILDYGPCKGSELAADGLGYLSEQEKQFLQQKPELRQKESERAEKKQVSKSPFLVLQIS